MGHWTEISLTEVRVVRHTGRRACSRRVVLARAAVGRVGYGSVLVSQNLAPCIFKGLTRIAVEVSLASTLATDREPR